MRNKVVLSCADCQSRNYTTNKNKQESSSRIEVKKYCKHCNAHTIHRETK